MDAVLSLEESNSNERRFLEALGPAVEPSELSTH
jgi:hypothetical protein